MTVDTRKTSRGFALGEFKDGKGVLCSIQESSLATQWAIWFGTKDADPRHPGPDGKLIPVPLPEVNHAIGQGILFNDRMHLGTKEVGLLVHEFCKFRKKRCLDARTFTDLYGCPCSIKVTQGRIELGCDDPRPQICDHGWRPLKMPEGTVYTIHMHLGIKQINELLPMMRKFLRTGWL